jgi:hypothetical protein
MAWPHSTVLHSWICICCLDMRLVCHFSIPSGCARMVPEIGCGHFYTFVFLHLLILPFMQHSVSWISSIIVGKYKVLKARWLSHQLYHLTAAGTWDAHPGVCCVSYGVDQCMCVCVCVCARARKERSLLSFYKVRVRVCHGRKCHNKFCKKKKKCSANSAM